MDRAALLGQLINVFLAELSEHVDAQNRDLLALEAPEISAEEQAALLRSLLRSAHSLKGASRAVGASAVEKLCHGIEELLIEISEGRLRLDRELFALFFASVDALVDAGTRLREGRDFAGSPADAVTAWIGSVRAGPDVPDGPDKPPPTLALGPRERPMSSQPSGPLQEVSSRDASSQEAMSVKPRSSGSSEPTFVRVSVRKLDALLTQTGELTVANAGLERSLEELASLGELVARFRADWQRVERPLERLLAEAPEAASKSTGRSFEQAKQIAHRLDEEMGRVYALVRAAARSCRMVSYALDAEVKNVRMLPFAEACQGLGRMARDLAQDRGKEVELVIRGGDVELDRGVLDGLKAPLMHLVRNAVDHGIETPEQRRLVGKPLRGRVEVEATLRGGEVLVTVTDDGRGLDVDAIAERAQERGLPSVVSVADAARVIFSHGFSTSRSLSVVSGRGLGLDVVKSSVESLHGHVDAGQVAPHGLRFSLTVPLTITTIGAVLLEVAGQTFAFASTNVERLARVGEGDLKWVKGRPVFFFDSTAYDVVSLAELLGLPMKPLEREGVGAHLVIVSGRGHGLALLVDALLGVEEILVKSLGRRLKRVRYVTGATVLPSGKVALILNAGALLGETSRRGVARVLATAVTRDAITQPVKRRIVVVDDSVTTRSLNKSVLESAGFEVLAASNGQEALRLIESEDVDLVLSDVEMPLMDGLTLTATIRSSPKHARLPVVLMTGLGSERDKARGLEVGADAYLVKSAFDKDVLLETIMQLL